MATDLLPKTDGCDRQQKEAEKFAINLNDKVVVRVEDEAAVAVLNQILTSLGGSTGTIFRLFNRNVTTPGTQQVVLATVVGTGETLTPKVVRLVGRKPTRYEIKIDGNIIGSGMIGPSNVVDEFVWYADEVLTATQTLEVAIVQIAGTPASDVDVHFQGLKTT